MTKYQKHSLGKMSMANVTLLILSINTFLNVRFNICSCVIQVHYYIFQLNDSDTVHFIADCGSCWAHAALSALADRIKIARDAQGDDINLSIQYVLNCGAGVAGSCQGGSHTGTYQLIKEKGAIPYDTCAPYIACSSDSQEGFCSHVDTTCNPLNTCRTCSTFSANGGTCEPLEYYPNATVAEYGEIRGGDKKEVVMKIKKEIKARGPVAATINASPLRDFLGGKVYDVKNQYTGPNHIVSIVGWGKDADGKEFWHVSL